MQAASPIILKEKDSKEYQRRIRAWTMYDWANSAFATTILGAVLPAYYSSVAGANLPSEAIATAYWSVGLSVSLFIVAILSPILGTVSDIMRGKKKFLAFFAVFGIIGTGLLVLVDTGDFILASILFLVGRIGFAGANVFYDALLPHVATEEDQDSVSTRGYAMGYLGGGLLLAVNVAMIMLLPGNWGARLSFLSVGIWWAVFSIPLFRRVPEPPAAGAALEAGKHVIKASFERLKITFSEITKYSELFKFLVAFLIYNDGIGTIIGVAVIYGAELGFGTIELVLALLLVQFVGIPFSILFGKLPSKNTPNRHFFLAFVILNLIALPLAGILGAQLLPHQVSGAPLPDYQTTASAQGQGVVVVDSGYLTYQGDWQTVVIPGSDLEVGGIIGFLNNPLGGDLEDETYVVAGKASTMDFAFNGQKVRLTYQTGPEMGSWAVLVDGSPLLEDTGEAVILDTYNETVRYGVTSTFLADKPGEHVMTLEPLSGGSLAFTQLEVLAPIRQNNLGAIIGLVVAVELVTLGLAWLLKGLFKGLAESFNTKRSIYLALIMYSAISVWGFFLNSTVEFWFLAWMVAVVQGGSQALSRSLYASMSPASKSGEFFGFFGIMEKFASLIGPLLFAAAGLIFGNSRPAVLSLIVLFIIGMIVLGYVDVEKGRKIAQEEDARVAAQEG